MTGAYAPTEKSTALLRTRGREQTVAVVGFD